MKKIFTALFAITLIFSPIGDTIFQDQVTTVEAKKYRSGKKSFNPGANNNSNIQKKQQSNYNKSNANQNNRGGFTSGGLMRGLMLGGLAGLLFGGLLGGMGILGNILGLMINVLAIVFLIFVAAKLFSFFTRKQREKEEKNVWKN